MNTTAANVLALNTTSRLLRIDHATVTHYNGFSVISSFNEDGTLIGTQTFGTDGDTPTTNERGRAWRHSEAVMFGVQITLTELNELDIAGEVQHYDSHGKIMD
jgi:hypothetical protein